MLTVARWAVVYLQLASTVACAAGVAAAWIFRTVNTAAAAAFIAASTCAVFAVAAALNAAAARPGLTALSLLAAVLDGAMAVQYRRIAIARRGWTMTRGGQS